MDAEQVPLIPATAIERVPDPAPPPNRYRYVLYGYWPRGNRWRVFAEQLYDNWQAPGLREEIRERQEAGWRSLRILELPE